MRFACLEGLGLDLQLLLRCPLTMEGVVEFTAEQDLLNSLVLLSAEVLDLWPLLVQTKGLLTQDLPVLSSKMPCLLN